MLSNVCQQYTFGEGLESRVQIKYSNPHKCILMFSIFYNQYNITFSLPISWTWASTVLSSDFIYVYKNQIKILLTGVPEILYMFIDQTEEFLY